MPFCANESNGCVTVTLDDDFSLEDTLTSGQTFRWVRFRDGFMGIVGEKVCYVTQNDNVVVFQGCTLNEYNDIWMRYFSFDEDYKAIREHLSYDENVVRAMTKYSGIRIMRQPLWETVISFIISANNNIPRIMGIIDRLCKRFGNKINTEYGEFYSFPTPKSLAEADVADIRACGAGYRDEYIKRTAMAFASGEFCGDDLCDLSRLEARKALMQLYGVGAKVADCILLFSVGKEDAFPIDTWVRKVMCSLYLGEDDAKAVSVKKIEELAQKQFPKYAGYAQQVLFHYVRNTAQEA